MWIKPLVTVTLILLDIGLLGLLVLQAMSRQAVAYNLLLPALAFNVFGAAIFWAVERDH